MNENRRNPILSGIILLLVCLVGVGIRLFDLKDPPLDFHGVRQLRSAVIARGVYYQISPDFSQELKQQAADLAILETYEPPIFENLVGLTYVLIGSEELWISRVYSAVFWLSGGIAIYLILQRFHARPAAIISLAFYFFLPFSILASRSFQPEPLMVMWIAWTMYALIRWMEKPGWKTAIWVGALGSLAVLFKVVAGLFVLSMLISAALFEAGFKKAIRSWQFWMMGAIMCVPTLTYYLFFQTERSSSFLSFWVGSLSWMVFAPEFYADWLAMIKGLMGLTTFLFAIVGYLLAEKRMKILLSGLWLGYLLYGLVFPYQYTTHEYYHLPLVVIVALSLAALADVVYRELKSKFWVWRVAASLCVAFACFYAVYISRSAMAAADYRLEIPSWQRVGEAIPPNAKVIALTGDYGMRLRYYGWRASNAWPSAGEIRLRSLSGGQEIDYPSYFSEVTAGEDFFLVTAFGELDQQPELKEMLADHFPVAAEGNGFILYDLKHPIP